MLLLQVVFIYIFVFNIIVKMLINRSDISVLQHLSTMKDLVPIEKIPSSFRQDFNKFFFGKTLVKDDQNHLFVYPSDIRRWIRVLFLTYK